MNQQELMQKMETVIHNLNEDGLALMYRLMGDMHEIKKYNISTTPEQIARIKQQEREKAILAEAKRREREHEEYMKRMAEERAEREKAIASLTGKDKLLFDKIEKVKRMGVSRYCMTFSQCNLIANIYNNNYINASYDDFCYGFYQGMQYMKNQAKKIREAGATNADA